MKICIQNDWDQIAKASAEGKDQVVLVYEGEYKRNDVICFSGLEPRKLYVIGIDAAIPESCVYVTADQFRFVIPFDQHKTSYNPVSFAGCRHYVYIRHASEEEAKRYRNLAVNPMDQHEETAYDGSTASHNTQVVGGIGTRSGEGTGAGGSIVRCETHVFPHASANVETRDEAVFQARNAIDGYLASCGNGEWPYASWGINRQADAAFTLDFGRPVDFDEMRLYTRSDFPHDSWWISADLVLSDGSRRTLSMDKKTGEPHIFRNMKAEKITWLRLENLIKAEDPSPFPALTQIEVYGKDSEPTQADEKQCED